MGLPAKVLLKVNSFGSHQLLVSRVYECYTNELRVALSDIIQKHSSFPGQEGNMLQYSQDSLTKNLGAPTDCVYDFSTS